MQYTVIIQQDEEGWFIGSVPEVPSARTQAQTLPQLYERLEEVLRLCLEVQKDSVPLKFIGVQNLTLSA